MIVVMEPNATEAEVEATLQERAQARADRDWAKADAMRDKLEAMSIVVMDRPEGPVWRVKLRGDSGD